MLRTSSGDHLAHQRRAEEQRQREEEEKRRAEELRVAWEREEDELRRNAEARRLAVDDFKMCDAENLAETEAGSSDIAKDGDCLNCKVKRQEDRKSVV